MKSEIHKYKCIHNPDNEACWIIISIELLARHSIIAVKVI